MFCFSHLCSVFPNYASINAFAFHLQKSIKKCLFVALEESRTEKRCFLEAWWGGGNVGLIRGWCWHNSKEGPEGGGALKGGMQITVKLNTYAGILYIFMNKIFFVGGGEGRRNFSYGFVKGSTKKTNFDQLKRYFKL